MAAVEVIGTENISEIIRNSKLSKFVVYRFGSGKGATPVYESIYTKTSELAAKSFEDWAAICLRDNPFNTNPYEIFLYQKEGAAEDILKDDDASESETSRTNVKRNKRRFSFMLASPYGNNSQNHSNNSGSVSEQVSRALNDFKRELEIKELKEKIKELEEGDDDDVNPLQDILELSRNLSGIKKKRTVAVAEDEDDEEDEDDLEEEDDGAELDDEDDEVESSDKTQQKKTAVKKTKFTTEQRLRINKAVHILAKKRPRIDKDLMKLATVSLKKPGLFDTMIESLTNLQV